MTLDDSDGLDNTKWPAEVCELVVTGEDVEKISGDVVRSLMIWDEDGAVENGVNFDVR